MKRPIVTLLTDFGTRDHYVAAMKGVTADSVTPTMKAYDPTGAVIVLVGDRKVIEPGLQAAGFGKIQGMDAI